MATPESRISPDERLDEQALRVLIADDERIARQRLRWLLEKEENVEIACECFDGRSAVSAFDKHAIHAFETCALDYLLKPVAAARLAKTLMRVRRYLRSTRWASSQP